MHLRWRSSRTFPEEPVKAGDSSIEESYKILIREKENKSCLTRQCLEDTLNRLLLSKEYLLPLYMHWKRWKIEQKTVKKDIEWRLSIRERFKTRMLVGILRSYDRTSEVLLDILSFISDHRSWGELFSSREDSLLVIHRRSFNTADSLIYCSIC